MLIALAQLAFGRDIKENLTRNLHVMGEASRGGADIIVFPELCLSPFFPRIAGQDASRYAMRLDSEYVHLIRQRSRDLRLIASPNTYLEEEGQRFDASLLIDENGEIVGVSKMVHIAQVPGFYEQDYYTASNSGFKAHDTSLGRIGIVVCFDRHYPESIRTCTLKGAKVILIPTANTMDEPRDLFECELRTAAMQNGVYIAMCNRVGREGDAVFCGESTVVDPDGAVIFKANESEGLSIVDIDLAKVETSRRSRPYLSLRRPEAYEGW